MKTILYFIITTIVFVSCKKEEEIKNLKEELSGVYALYWTSYTYQVDDSVYLKTNLNAPGSVSWTWIIESYGSDYRAFPIKGEIKTLGEPEIVPKEVVRYFSFGKPILNKIFFKDFFSHIYDKQKNIFYYYDSVTLAINRNYPTAYSNSNFALTGTLKDSMYVKVGQKPPGIPKPDIYAWVRVTYNIVCEKYCSIEQWKKDKVDYVVEGD